MIVLFDANFLHLLFDNRARVPLIDKQPVVDRAQERIDHLVATTSKHRDKIIIPTPALTEFLLLAADKRNDYLEIIRRRSVFEIAGFNGPEVVELVDESVRVGRKRLKTNTPETWAKLKYDRQIIAIAKTMRVGAIYTTNKKDFERYANDAGIDCFNLADLPLPPPVQMSLPSLPTVQAQESQDAEQITEANNNPA